MRCASAGVPWKWQSLLAAGGRTRGTSQVFGCTLRGMGADRYWSVEECCWVESPPASTEAVEVTVPQQREDVPVEEPVEA